MSDCFITRRGGSGLFAFAYIYATIPADSTATCVCGQVSATPYLLDSRHIIFKVPSVGTWVVTATQNPSAGYLSVSKSVTVSLQGQVLNVDILYDIIIPLAKSGWAYKKGSTPTINTINRVSDNALGMFTSADTTRYYYNTAIDITGYNNIILSYEAVHSINNTRLGIGQGEPEMSEPFLKSWNPSAIGTYNNVEIDISGVDISDAYFMWAGSGQTHDYLVSARITI